MWQPAGTFFSVVLLSLLLATSTNAWPVYEYGALKQTVAPSSLQTEIKPALVVAGDVMLGRHVERIMNKYGSDYVWSGLPTYPSQTALMVNFESAMTNPHIHTPDFTFQFATAKRNLPPMHQFGVTHASLMNNHSLDYGPAGFELTKQSLEENQITALGELDTPMATTSIEAAPYTIGILAVDFISRSPAKSELEAAIKELQKDNDIVLAYPHWGIEYQSQASVEQEWWAKLFIDAGANAVIGHHPHVVQAIDWYKGAPIFYSLGNLVFDQYFDQSVQTGLFIEITMTDKVVNYKLQPYNSIGSRPQLMSAKDKENFLTKLALISDKEIRDFVRLGKIEQPR